MERGEVRRFRRRDDMCEHCPEVVGTTPPVDEPSTGPDRRSVLSGFLRLPLIAAGVGGLALPATTGASPDTRTATQPPIVRRSKWGGDLRPKGEIPAEEVRYLLVHHTADPGSDYSQGEVVGLLRSIYGFHTGASKGWPDVAYNFFVDKFGTIYEGRTGSVDGPVRGSATGGNQGYSQLCCFLGDFNAAPPPEPALASMYSLLAWLADRYGVDTNPGARVQFTSLGSNRWPAGASVDAATISAHRDMSQTTCPGDACYALVTSVFPQEVSARRAVVPTTTQPAPTTSAPPVEPAVDATTSTSAAPADDVTTTTTTVDRADGDEIASSGLEDDSSSSWPVIAGIAVIGAAAAGGAIAATRRSRRSPDGAGAGVAPGATIAWRMTKGGSDPLVHALATAARPIVGTGDDWWDDLVDQWHVTAPTAVGGRAAGGAGVGATVGEPSSFLVASDGERALIRLAGDATGVAVLADGSTLALTRQGVTKVWLTSTTVRLTLDDDVTQLQAYGVHGRVDRTLRPRS